MILKIDHIVITSKDILQTTEFYQKLGFNIRQSNNRFEMFAGDFKINVHILSNEISPHAKNVQTGSADICFEISSDIKVLHSELLNQKIDIHLGPVIRHGAFGEMESIYIYDPDGNLIEFCKYKNNHN